jgi:Flp pilus assembly protein protease CpaA
MQAAFGGGLCLAPGEGGESVQPFDTLHLAVLVWLTACAVSDVRRGEIANALTLPALAAGAAIALGGGWERVVILSAVLAIGLSVYAAGWMGGADMKILAALAGLWPEALPVALIGICAWGLARRLMGLSGNFRAVAPMLAGMMVSIGSEWLRTCGGKT